MLCASVWRKKGSERGSEEGILDKQVRLRRWMSLKRWEREEGGFGCLWVAWGRLNRDLWEMGGERG